MTPAEWATSKTSAAMDPELPIVSCERPGVVAEIQRAGCRSDEPIRKASIEWAAWRPSAIAQTIRLWPRVMSPAVKTLSMLVRLFASAFTRSIRSGFDPELFEHPLAVRADEAHRQQDEVGRIGLLGAGDLDERCIRP